MDESFKKKLTVLSKQLKVVGKKTTGRKRFQYNKYHLLAGQALYVISMRDSKMIYQRGIEELLGYKEDEFNYESVFDLIHEDDYPVVKKVVELTMDHLQKKGMSEDAVFYVTYRMRKKDGTFIQVQRASGVCTLHQTKTLKGHYSIIQDISYLNIESGVRWFWKSPIHPVKEIKENVNNVPEEIFTDRELEVFELILEGLNGAEIAEKLDISINTLKTHRKKILQKTGCLSSAELIQNYSYIEPEE